MLCLPVAIVGALSMNTSKTSQESSLCHPGDGVAATPKEVLQSDTGDP